MKSHHIRHFKLHLTKIVPHVYLNRTVILSLVTVVVTPDQMPPSESSELVWTSVQFFETF